MSQSTKAANASQTMTPAELEQWERDIASGALFGSKDARDLGRECLWCGEAFQVTYEQSPQRFCSSRCAGESRRTHPRWPCPGCGRETTREFCSVLCARKARGEPGPAPQALKPHELAFLGGVLAVQGYRLVQIEPVPSMEPGTVFRVHKEVEEPTGAAEEWPWRQSGLLVGPPPPRPKKPLQRTALTCANCSETFMVPPSASYRKYCSQACAGAARGFKTMVPCARCGTLTYNALYCSHECRARMQAAVR